MLKTIAYHAGQYRLVIPLYSSKLSIAICYLLPHAPLVAFLNGLHTSLFCVHIKRGPSVMIQVPRY